MTTVAETRRAGQTNECVELARYTVSAGERVIHAQRILGVVRLVDNPASGEGRHYVIERELMTMAELEAIVTDYLQQAEAWDAIPAAGPCCVLAELREQARPPPSRGRQPSRADRPEPCHRHPRRALHRAPRGPTAAVRARPVRRRCGVR